MCATKKSDLAVYEITVPQMYLVYFYRRNVKGKL